MCRTTPITGGRLVHGRDAQEGLSIGRRASRRSYVGVLYRYAYPRDVAHPRRCHPPTIRVKSRDLGFVLGFTFLSIIHTPTRHGAKRTFVRGVTLNCRGSRWKRGSSGARAWPEPSLEGVARRFTRQ
eukprot:3955614-Pyramimonas_sp.AAC.1